MGKIPLLVAGMIGSMVWLALAVLGVLAGDTVLYMSGLAASLLAMAGVVVTLAANHYVSEIFMMIAGFLGVCLGGLICIMNTVAMSPIYGIFGVFTGLGMIMGAANSSER